MKGLDQSGKLEEKIEYVVSETPSYEAPQPPLSGEDDLELLMSWRLLLVNCCERSVLQTVFWVWISWLKISTWNGTRFLCVAMFEAYVSGDGKQRVDRCCLYGGLHVDLDANVVHVKILRIDETEVLKHSANYLEAAGAQSFLESISTAQIKVLTNRSIGLSMSTAGVDLAQAYFMRKLSKEQMKKDDDTNKITKPAARRKFEEEDDSHRVGCFSKVFKKVYPSANDPNKP